MLKTKSLRSPAAAADGLRVLVSRFRGRGLPRSAYALWLPALGPSERLLRRWQGGRLSWAQFARAYQAELFSDGRVDARNRTVKNHGQKFLLRLLRHLSGERTVTLLCHCGPAEPHCHRHLLARLLRRRRL
jgi:uncharacterized protein YeaO (DUF488 family)